jgi:hypothetical protein
MNMRLLDNWSEFTRATAEANRLNKIIIFDALAKAQITHVVVGFDGEGGQSRMDRAVARNDEKLVEFPEVTLSLFIADFDYTELGVGELSLQEGVEHICYGYLEDRHGGWEIKEGSIGEFAFDVVTRTFTLNFYGQLIDTDYHNHTL